MIKRVTLSGSEVKVEDLGGQNAAIKNLGGGTIYASAFPNITEDADNVIEIPAGGGEVLLNARGTVYLLGTGKIQLTGTDYAAPNFKLPSSSSGGGGEESEKGAYCGIAEFVSNSADVKTTTIDYTDDFSARLAEILAIETGWELQNDGVTVLKDGGVGFKFTSGYVYLANNLGAPSGYNFQYISGSTENGVTIDIFTSSAGTVAFGCRGINGEMNFPFILAQNSNRKDVALAEYSSQKLYLLAKDKSDGDIFTVETISKDPEIISTALALLPDDTDGCLFKDVFFLMSCPSVDLSGDSIFEIGGSVFRLLKCAAYDGAPLLAVKRG